MAAWSAVGASSTFVVLLKMTIPSCWPPLRCPASSRAAAIALSIASPCMLALASITRIAPNSPPSPSPEPSSSLLTGSPFSVTLMSS